jgi:hypothetical protein
MPEQQEPQIPAVAAVEQVIKVRLLLVRLAALVSSS